MISRGIVVKKYTRRSRSQSSTCARNSHSKCDASSPQCENRIQQLADSGQIFLLLYAQSSRCATTAKTDKNSQTGLTRADVREQKRGERRWNAKLAPELALAVIPMGTMWRFARTRTRTAPKTHARGAEFDTPADCEAVIEQPALSFGVRSPPPCHCSIFRPCHVASKGARLNFNARKNDRGNRADAAGIGRGGRQRQVDVGGGLGASAGALFRGPGELVSGRVVGFLHADRDAGAALRPARRGRARASVERVFRAHGTALDRARQPRGRPRDGAPARCVRAGDGYLRDHRAALFARGRAHLSGDGADGDGRAQRVSARGALDAHAALEPARARHRRRHRGLGRGNGCRARRVSRATRCAARARDRSRGRFAGDRFSGGLGLAKVVARESPHLGRARAHRRRSRRSRFIGKARQNPR